MIISSEQKQIARKAVLGVALLAAFASHSSAQSADDALINKLEQKGILTTKEAQELRTEASQDFTTAAHSKANMPDWMVMPDWVKSYKLSGDFRGRFEQLSGDNDAFVDRVRLRYRLRVGLTVNLHDNLEVGFRFGSGDPASGFATGNPLSGTSTFQDNFSSKSLYVDAAYGKWSPLNSDSWLLSATIGKMDNPFAFTPMVFDQDLTPEGGAIQSGWTINDKQSLSLTGAAFVLDEESAATQDPFMYGGQLLWKAKWTKKLATTLGVGAFQIVNAHQLNTVNVPYINRGNTRVPFVPLIPPGSSALYVLKYNYTPVIADAGATYTLDSFPFYKGAFPLKFAGEYMHNPGAPANNDGYWVGVTFGQSGKKKTWDISYRYEYLGADAWYDQLVDDDNLAFYPGDNPNANSTFGYYGGTNIKGHQIRFNYSFTDSLTFSITCFLNELINRDGLVADYYVPDTKTSATMRFMADMMWKF
ncbi:MAG TPA: putative porin [Verrucomicrobiae bacterium]